MERAVVAEISMACAPVPWVTDIAGQRPDGATCCCCGFCYSRAGAATITDWRGEREKVGERLDAHGDVEQTGGRHVDGGRTFFSLGVAALVLKE